MLVGTADRGVHRDRPVDLAHRISLRQQLGQHGVPGPVSGVATVALPHRLPRPEHLARQVAPRNPGAVVNCPESPGGLVVYAASGMGAVVVACR